MIQPGSVYCHYKGLRCYVLLVAKHHEFNGARDVVYIELSSGETCTRPLQRDSRNEDSWTDVVTWPDGVRRARFVRASPAILDIFNKKET